MLANKTDELYVAKTIAEVRNTGRVNMFDRLGVIDILYDMGEDFSADYLKANKNDYMKLLKLSEKF